MEFTTPSKNRMGEIFKKIRDLKVGVLGDFALDVYFQQNTQTGETSLETGKPVFHASQLKAAPGAAGNVVANAAALKPKALYALGVVGPDLFGQELFRALSRVGANTRGLIIQEKEFQTFTYVKPHEGRKESSRLDFGAGNRVLKETKEKMKDLLKSLTKDLDVLILNQQFSNPTLDSPLLESVDPNCFTVADFRHLGQCQKPGTIKANIFEVARYLKMPAFNPLSSSECGQHGLFAHKRLGSPLLLSRGEAGLMFFEDGKYIEIPGVFTLGEVDTVGAGDTCTAVFACAKRAGASGAEAAAIANLASAVTVQKIFQTGTASPDEILEQHSKTSYNFNLDLAKSPQKARFMAESEIEIISSLPENFEPRFALMDHDGTLSTLRQGWETAMFDHAIDSILGRKKTHLPSGEYSRIASRVHQMIELTTGVQTLRQMEYLATMVREEGFAKSVLSPVEYKQQFNVRLMSFVEKRAERFKKGELGVEDLTVKGSPQFLKLLANKNVKVFLASGTDQDDVREEAAFLGYAPLFKGGIHGSLGNEVGDAKKKVIQRILNAEPLAAKGLLVFGDGPVEIREGKKAGAFCVGVASDEIRRFGLDKKKRERLIRAGADLIIPDFSQTTQLFNFLFSKSGVTS